MYKIIGVLAIGACLISCVADEDDKGTSSSSSSSGAGSSSSSSSSGGPANRDFSDYQADRSVGGNMYNQSCQFSGCHGANGEGDNAIRWPLYTDNKLFHYIEDKMPKGHAEDCVGQCAANITSFLSQFRVVESSCKDVDAVLFSERSLPLLTPYEYKNSIVDLFPAGAVPSDFLDPLSVDTTMGFPNSLHVKVAEPQGLRYFNNANSIAEWNKQNGALQCSSTNKTACANEFVEGFAKMAFRRPLTGSATTSGSEVWHIHQIFDEAPSTNDGLKWAIIGTLTSPNFLYRTELGMKAEDAANDPAFVANKGGGSLTGNIEDYEALGGGQTQNGTTFNADNGEARTRGGEDAHLLWTNGGVDKSFTFSETDIITIHVGGNDYNNQWPQMVVTVDGQEVAAEEVITPDYDLKVYQYVVLGLNGSNTIDIGYSNDGGASGAEGDPGTDIDLYIGDVTVAPAQLKGGDSSVADFTAKLQSLANDSGAYVLDPYELASVLSFLLTGSTPDAQLMSAAGSGQLNSNEGVHTQIRRLLATDRAESHMKYFVTLWFRSERLNTNAALPDGVAEAMKSELQEFFWHIFDNDDVPFSEFYTADYTFLNRTLAQHYGISGANGTSFVKTDLPSTRGGITTMGAFLSSFAHGVDSAPVLRGVHVREDMLCHHIGPPPSLAEDEGVRSQKDKEAQAATESGTLNTREFFRISTESDGCGTCHYEDINPLGFAMADFDGVGVYRTQQIAIGTEDNSDGGTLVDINAKGALWDPEIDMFTSHVEEIPVDGGRELSLALANTNSVQYCLTEKAFRLAVNRPFNVAGRDLWNTAVDRELTDVEAENFACAQEQLSKALKTSNQSLKVLFETLGNLDLIRFRR